MLPSSPQPATTRGALRHQPTGNVFVKITNDLLVTSSEHSSQPSGVAKASHLNTRNLPLTLCCFADFKGGGSDTTDPKVTTLEDVDPYHRGSAHTYFPKGYLAYLDDKAKGVIEPQAIYFPYITGSERYYWTTIKGGAITSYALRISPWHVLEVYTNYNTRLGGVRCVREDY